MGLRRGVRLGRCGWVAGTALAVLAAGCARSERAAVEAPVPAAVTAPVAVAPAVTPEVVTTADLTASLDALFDHPDFANAFWGVRVERLDGSVIYDRNGQKRLIPASNMKLVTTAAALELLGPDYTYETRLEAAGTVDAAGALQGDLVILGSGDPSLGTWRIEGRPDGDGLLQGWVEKVKAAGIKEVRGAVVADGRVYTKEYVSGDWEYEDLPFWYAAGTCGVNFSENVFRFTTAPGAAVGDPATLSFKPVTRYFTVINETKTVASGGKKDADITFRDPASNVVTFGGTMPIDAQPFEQRGSVADGELYAATLLVEALERGGVVVKGGAATARVPAEAARLDAVASEKRTVIDRVSSPPMREIVRMINKPSHNFYADCAFRSMGVAKKGKGDYDGGSEAVKDWLKGIGVPDLDSFDILDGSGMARRDFVTARLMCGLLRYMQQNSASFEIYKDSLPTPGQEYKKRDGWKPAELQGRLYAKTGYIGNVRSLSGYLLSADDEPLVFSMISNNITVSIDRADEAIDGALILVARSRQGKAAQ
jgi:D-alanyl-D-alanine carboxypeptidase/D-alanyl-D-alanine-endopeptidase (penicillin-binding protein 4)